MGVNAGDAGGGGGGDVGGGMVTTKCTGVGRCGGATGGFSFSG